MKQPVLSGDERFRLEKIAADSITLTVGTSGETIADLLSAHDGNIFDLTEAAATPGIDLIIDFIDVIVFDRVRALANYDGSANHSVAIAVWNWITSAWDIKDSMSGVEKSLVEHGFFIYDDANYIGKGVNFGRVRVNLLHALMGNVSHHTFIDEVALYKFVK